MISGVRNCFFYYFRSYPFSIWIFFQFFLFFFNSFLFYRGHILNFFQNLYLIVKRFMIFNESNIYSFRKFICIYLFISNRTMCRECFTEKAFVCQVLLCTGLIELARETCPSLFSRVFLVLLTPESEKKMWKNADEHQVSTRRQYTFFSTLILTWVTLKMFDCPFCFYRTRAIISRSPFEATLVYKPQILGQNFLV